MCCSFLLLVAFCSTWHEGLSRRPRLPAFLAVAASPLLEVSTVLILQFPALPPIFLSVPGGGPQKNELGKGCELGLCLQLPGVLYAQVSPLLSSSRSFTLWLSSSSCFCCRSIFLPCWCVASLRGRGMESSSSIVFQITWLPCDLSHLMGSDKIVVLQVSWLFLGF